MFLKRFISKIFPQRFTCVLNSDLYDTGCCRCGGSLSDGKFRRELRTPGRGNTDDVVAVRKDAGYAVCSERLRVCRVFVGCPRCGGLSLLRTPSVQCRDTKRCPGEGCL